MVMDYLRSVDFKDTLGGIFSTALNILDKPRGAAIAAAKLENPLKGWESPSDYQGSEVFGIQKIQNPTTRKVLGTAADIVLDPLNIAAAFVPVGGEGFIAARIGGKAAAKTAATALAKGAVREGAEGAAKGIFSTAVKDATKRVGQQYAIGAGFSGGMELGSFTADQAGLGDGAKLGIGLAGGFLGGSLGNKAYLKGFGPEGITKARKLGMVEEQLNEPGADYFTHLDNLEAMSAKGFKVVNGKGKPMGYFDDFNKANDYASTHGGFVQAQNKVINPLMDEIAKNELPSFDIEVIDGDHKFIERNSKLIPVNKAPQDIDLDNSHELYTHPFYSFKDSNPSLDAMLTNWIKGTYGTAGDLLRNAFSNGSPAAKQLYSAGEEWRDWARSHNTPFIKNGKVFLYRGEKNWDVPSKVTGGPTPLYDKDFVVSSWTSDPSVAKGFGVDSDKGYGSSILGKWVPIDDVIGPVGSSPTSKSFEHEFLVIDREQISDKFFKELTGVAKDTPYGTKTYQVYDYVSGKTLKHFDTEAEAKAYIDSAPAQLETPQAFLIERPVGGAVLVRPNEVKNIVQNISNKAQYAIVNKGQDVKVYPTYLTKAQYDGYLKQIGEEEFHKLFEVSELSPLKVLPVYGNEITFEGKKVLLQDMMDNYHAKSIGKFYEDGVIDLNFIPKKKPAALDYGEATRGYLPDIPKIDDISGGSLRTLYPRLDLERGDKFVVTINDTSGYYFNDFGFNTKEAAQEWINKYHPANGGQIVPIGDYLANNAPYFGMFDQGAPPVPSIEPAVTSLEPPKVYNPSSWYVVYTKSGLPAIEKAFETKKAALVYAQQNLGDAFGNTETSQYRVSRYRPENEGLRNLVDDIPAAGGGGESPPLKPPTGGEFPDPFGNNKALVAVPGTLRKGAQGMSPEEIAISKMNIDPEADRLFNDIMNAGDAGKYGDTIIAPPSGLKTLKNTPVEEVLTDAGIHTPAIVADLDTLDAPMRQQAEAFYLNKMGVDKPTEELLKLYAEAFEKAGKTDPSYIGRANSILRGVWATGDGSWFGIQGLLTLPRLVATGQIRDAYDIFVKPQFVLMGNKKVFGEWLKHKMANLPEGAPDLVTVAKAGKLHLSFLQGNPDFDMRIMERLTLGRIDPDMAFATAGDMARISTFYNEWARYAKGGKAVDIEKLARAVNRATGIAEHPFGGQIGAFALFAPRFFQSQLEVIAKALSAGDIENSLARRQVLTMIGTGVGLTLTANYVRGYTDTDVFDPTSPNFMRIRNVAGQDISVFGPWDSLVKLIIHMGSGDIAYAQTKASPIINVLTNVIRGETFLGEPFDTDHMGNVAKSLLLPFAWQNVGRESIAGSALGFFGVKSSPQSASEIREANMINLGLDPKDPLAIREYLAEHPEQRSLFTDAQKSAATVQSDIKARAELNNIETINGKQTLVKFRDNRTILSREQRAKLDVILKDSDFKPDTEKRKWIDSYYKLFDGARDPITHDIIGTKLDKLMVQWIKVNGQEAYDYIQEYNLVGKTATDLAYLQDMAKLSSLGYFSIPKYNPAIYKMSGLNDDQIESYRDAVSAKRLADPKLRALPFTTALYIIYKGKLTSQQIAAIDLAGKDDYFNPQIANIKRLYPELTVWFNPNATWQTREQLIKAKASSGRTTTTPTRTPTRATPIATR